LRTRLNDLKGRVDFGGLLIREHTKCHPYAVDKTHPQESEGTDCEEEGNEVRSAINSVSRRRLSHLGSRTVLVEPFLAHMGQCYRLIPLVTSAGLRQAKAVSMEQVLHLLIRQLCGHSIALLA
jgi:hypothetical protein